MRKLVVVSTLMINLILTGCISMAPVSNPFESANTLDKGQLEEMGNYSLAILSWEDENNERRTDHSNNNLGLRVGYGLTDRIDLKFRYERLLPVTGDDKLKLNGLNYFTLSPRYSFIPDKLAGGVDLSLYTYKVKETEDTGSYSDSEFAISPKFAFTMAPEENLDITVSTKIDFFTQGSGTFWHVNLGFGFSTDISKWSVRPEFGIIKNLDDFSSYTWYSLGFGITIRSFI